MNNQFDIARKLIQDGKLLKALENVLDIYEKNNKSKHEQVLLLKYRYKEFVNNDRLGIDTTNGKERNLIAFSLLKLIGTEEDVDNKIDELKKNSLSFYLKKGVLVFLFFCLMVFVLVLGKMSNDDSIVIEGRVFTENYIPVANAIVNVDGTRFTSTSGTDGYYSITTKDMRIDENISLILFHEEYGNIIINSKLESKENKVDFIVTKE